MNRAALLARYGIDAYDGPDAPCTIDRHEKLRRSDAATFAAATEHVGWQEESDGPGFEIRNCVSCGSSIVRAS